jgi:hypothetical protein
MANSRMKWSAWLIAGSKDMVRWIAFDDDTAEALVCRLRRGAAEIQHNSPVDAALKTDRPSVIVLPASTPGRLLIARFTPKNLPAAPSVPHSGIAPRFAVPAQRKPATSVRKPWWRNIVA